MANIKTILLVGSSIDGKVTVGSGLSSKAFSKMLTPAMATPINKLRVWADAVVVSRSTVENDNPSLVSATNPNLVRVILDRKLQLSADKKVFSQPHTTMVMTAVSKKHPQIKVLEEIGIEVICLDKATFLKEVKKTLISRNLLKVMVEGGGTFNSVLFNEKWIDELIVAYFPFLLGGKLTPTIYDGGEHSSIAEAISTKLISHEVIDSHMIVAHYKILYN
jgi:riboflavin-specific deaminase-like protein